MRLANMYACPIMVLHMSEHVLLLIFLLQQLLKMDVDSLKPSLSISLNLPLNRCHLGWASSGSLPVLTDVLQLHDRLLILQLFVPLLQVFYDPLSSLQLVGQCVNLSLLLLNDLFQF